MLNFMFVNGYFDGYDYVKEIKYYVDDKQYFLLDAN
jgi:hypothetical protein